MNEREKLLRQADDTYAELRQSVAGLTEDEMHQPWLGVWGVREILIHVGAWHEEMIPALQRIARGAPPYAEGTYDDADAWNARFVERKAGVKVADILVDLDASHRDFVAAAATLPEEHFAAGASTRALFEGVGAQHYQEHTAQIVTWRRRGAR
jgi:hypothetical protein